MDYLGNISYSRDLKNQLKVEANDAKNEQPQQHECFPAELKMAGYGFVNKKPNQGERKKISIFIGRAHKQSTKIIAAGIGLSLKLSRWHECSHVVLNCPILNKLISWASYEPSPYRNWCRATLAQ